MQKLISQLCQSENVDANEVIQEVSRKGFNINDVLNYQNKQTGDNWLIYAARFGNLNLIKSLTRSHFQINVNFTNNDGKNALHEACQNGHLDCVRYLVEAVKIDVNALRKGDWTPLMLACTKENPEIIEYLLSQNANLLQTNKDGWNAFHIAVREGNEHIVDMLMQKMSSELQVSQMKTRNGRTPAHTAALYGHLRILERLIQNEPSILVAKDCCGNTLFMDALLADHLHVIKYLMDTFKDINLYDKDNLENSSIHLVAQSGSLKTCQHIFDIYYDGAKDSNLIEVFSKDLNKFSMTPLHSACKNNRLDIVKFFIGKFENVEPKRLVALLEQKDCHERSSLDIVRTASKFKDIESIFKQFYK